MWTWNPPYNTSWKELQKWSGVGNVTPGVGYQVAFVWKQIRNTSQSTALHWMRVALATKKHAVGDATKAFELEYGRPYGTLTTPPGEENTWTTTTELTAYKSFGTRRADAYKALDLWGRKRMQVAVTTVTTTSLCANIPI